MSSLFSNSLGYSIYRRARCDGLYGARIPSYALDHATAGPPLTAAVLGGITAPICRYTVTNTTKEPL